MECGKNENLMVELHQLISTSRSFAVRLLNQNNMKKDQVGILMVLSVSGGLSQKQLAERLSVTPPSITVSIQKMDKMGYIRRVPDEKDKRIMRLQLTEEGKKTAQHMKGVMKEMETRLFEGISQEQQQEVCRCLMRMKENLNNMEKGNR